MSARDIILGRIRNNLDRSDEASKKVDEWLAQREPGPRPQRSQLPHMEQVDLFVKMAEEADATVTRVEFIGCVPEAVGEYLSAHNLPAQLVISPSELLGNLPWADWPTLEVSQREAVEADAVSLTPAFSGIAETGTIMTISGRETPTSLNFLPENHIVVLHESEVVGSYEDGWQRLRDLLLTKGGSIKMPRSVNFITGPSRTADIAMTLYLGAHGPRRLHIILVAADGG